MPTNAALLAARVLLTAMFLASGLSSLGDIAGTTAYFHSLGMPVPSAVTWAVCLFELVAGALVLIGLRTVPVALMLAAFSVAATFIGHYGQGGDDTMLAFMHTQALMKDIAIAGGFIALAIAGPGGWSIDARRR